MQQWLRFLAALAILLGLVATAGSVPASAVESRIALVINNTNYQNVPALPNTANDAAEIARLLQSLGFTVERQSDLTNVEFREVLRQFRRRADGSDVSLVYYAGHGMEIDRTNYLVPVDAVLDTDRSAEFEAVPLDLVTLASAGAKRFRLVILDACRNNPFLRQMTRSGASRSVGNGLAAVEPTTSDMLVAYSAREGTVAFDGAGAHSPYAQALIDNLTRPGLEIGQLFREVRDQVLTETGGAQEPFVYGSLSSREFFLNPPAQVVTEKAPGPPDGASASESVTAAPPAPAANACQYSDVHWQSALALDEIAAYEEHLRLFPNCPFASLARLKIERLKGGDARGTPAPAPQQKPADVAALPPVLQLPPTNEISFDASALQTELKRVGCYAGRIDGLWGKGSERALDDYIRYSGASLPERERDPALLARLKGDGPRVCPLRCGAQFEARDGACVRVACPRGETLRRDGRCVARPAAEVRRPKAEAQAEPQAKSAPQQRQPAAPEQGSKRADPRCGERATLSAMSAAERRRICGIE